MSELLIDVREFPEYAAGHISGSQLVPLAALARTSATWDPTTRSPSSAVQAAVPRWPLSNWPPATSPTSPSSKAASKPGAPLASPRDHRPPALVTRTSGPHHRRLARPDHDAPGPLRLTVLLLRDRLCRSRPRLRRHQRHLHDGHRPRQAPLEPALTLKGFVILREAEEPLPHFLSEPTISRYLFFLPGADGGAGAGGGTADVTISDTDFQLPSACFLYTVT